MKTSALIWNQPYIHFNITSPKMAANSQTNTLKASTGAGLCLSKKTKKKERKKEKDTGKIYHQPLFFKAIHVFTPALGQAVNVTVYAWSNKNRVLHQGNHVGQSLAHSQTFKSWNNKRNPPRTDNQTLSHSEHCEAMQRGTQRSRIHIPCQYQRYKTFIKTQPSE